MPEQSKHKLADKVILLLLTLLFLPFVLCISTVNSAVGSGGKVALVEEMNEKSGEWADYSRERMDALVNPRGPATSIAAVQSQICDMSEQERKLGILSGGSGAGPISGAYAGACSSLTTMKDSLDAQVTIFQSRREALEQSVLGLKVAAYNSDLAIYDRRAAFDALTDQIESLLAASVDESVADDLKAQLEVLEVLVPHVEGESPFGQKQAAAVASLRQSLGQVNVALSRVLETPAPDSFVVPRPASLASIYDDLWTYRGRLVTSYALAIGTDGFVIFAAMLLAFSAGRVRQAENALHRADHWLNEPGLYPDFAPPSGETSTPSPNKDSNVKGAS